MQKITPFLWFDTNAEEAINFYCSIFKNSKVLSKTYNPEGGPMPAGTLLVGSFTLNGQKFMALNGGPMYKFTEAVSFMIDCDSQEEIDYYWDKLLAGGEAQACGWLKDKFGLSWQITPSILNEFMAKGTPEQVGRVMQAFMQMVKFDIAELQKAFDG